MQELGKPRGLCSSLCPIVLLNGVRNLFSSDVNHKCPAICRAFDTVDRAQLLSVLTDVVDDNDTVRMV